MAPRPAQVLAAVLLTAMTLGAAPAAGEHGGECPGYEGDPRPQVVGTDGPDILHVPEGGIGCGLGGNDKLRAEKHGDTVLLGGDGDDIFCARNNDDDRVSGGRGHDRARTDGEDKLLDVEEKEVVVACRNPVAITY